MIEKKLLPFSKGLDEKSSPAFTDPERSYNIVNYELKNNKQLDKRIDPITYDTEFNTLLASVFDSVTKIWMWYSSNLPSDIATGYDYLIPVYGQNSDEDYILVIFYKTALGWTFGETVVTNGAFSSDVSWTKGAALKWSIADGKATHTSGATEDLKQDVSLVDSDDYWLIFTTSGATAGSVTPKLGIQAGTARTTNATFIEKITADTNSDTDTELHFTPTTDFDGSIDNVILIKEYGITQDLYDAGVEYNLASDLRLFSGSKRLSIADNINKAHFIRIDEDEEIMGGTMGIPAPLKKPEIEEMDEWDGNLFTDQVDHLADCCIVQIAYTCATETGDESNPSPVSHGVDFQWFSYDVDDASDDRFLKKIKVSNCYIPSDINQALQKELKYFKFYARFVRVTNGSVSSNLQFVQQEEIYNKDGENTYTLISPTRGSDISYENDVAPIAKDVIEIDNKTVIGNIKKRIEFPFSFEYYQKITINNENNNAFIDGYYYLP